MNRDEIMAFLPHRENMLLLDEVRLDENGIAHGRYRIKDDEFFCRGHFPGNPIVPGVIQCEIMAQSCAALVMDEVAGNDTLYSGIDNFRFKRPVRPGDLCETTAELVKRKGHLFVCKVTLSVDGQLCSKGELIFTLHPKQPVQQ
ncbi:MAG: 3-hydroxyacyl-ACP dehydratase FabZ family protein [Candidatus Cryptobacteroides sp.]